MWTYATCGMAACRTENPIELHLFSPVRCEKHVELLTAIAHYHCTSQALGLGHTVNFGRPWIAASECDYGVISLPYLDGPSIEEFHPGGNAPMIRCLWLVPITKADRDFKVTFGLEALEERFERAKFNFLDPARASVC
jgi:hypothetical protein